MIYRSIETLMLRCYCVNNGGVSVVRRSFFFFFFSDDEVDCCLNNQSIQCSLLQTHHRCYVRLTTVIVKVGFVVVGTIVIPPFSSGCVILNCSKVTQWYFSSSARRRNELQPSLPRFVVAAVNYLR